MRTNNAAANRIRNLRELIGSMSLSDFAKRANKDPAQLSGMMSGARPFGERAARSIEKNMNLPAGFLDRAEESELVAVKSDIKEIKVIEWSNATHPSTAPAIQTVFTFMKPNDHVFGLVVDNDAMTPQFKKGDVVLIDPIKKPRPGSYVIAAIGDVVVLRLYRATTLIDFELIPLNENFPSVKSNEAEIKIIGIVFESHSHYDN